MNTLRPPCLCGEITAILRSMGFFTNLLELSLDAAPWLVLGLVIGGLMKVLIPTEFLQRHLKGSGSGSIIKAALLGAPLPLCSCGVIPAALGLRKAGASKPATVSFLVSTPETGVDSISISYALLGPFMAIARPIAAIASAITAGLLVGKAEDKNEAKISKSKQNSCCESTSIEKETGCSTETEATTECCSPSSTDSAAHACCGTNTAYKKPESFAQKSWAGIHYAFTNLLDDIIVWLIIGLAFSAAIKTYLPPSFLAEWGSGLPAMLVMIAIGIPMYVCATASTPIAAGLMMAGISPGTALVFLMAGPATNVSTLGIIGKELGRRSLSAYLIGVCVIALVSGILLDFLIGYWSIDIQAQLSAGAHFIPHSVAWIALIVLIAVSLRRFLKPNLLLTSS